MVDLGEQRRECRQTWFFVVPGALLMLISACGLGAVDLTRRVGGTAREPAFTHSQREKLQPNWPSVLVSTGVGVTHDARCRRFASLHVEVTHVSEERAMDAIVVYESVYGNTRAVPKAIAAGLGATAVVPAHQAAGREGTVDS
jgi:hypothetical protein